jgi:hypothetical protein
MAAGAFRIVSAPASYPEVQITNPWTRWWLWGRSALDRFTYSGTDVGWVDLMGRMAKMKPEPRKASGK